MTQEKYPLFAVYNYFTPSYKFYGGEVAGDCVIVSGGVLCGDQYCWTGSGTQERLLNLIEAAIADIALPDDRIYSVIGNTWPNKDTPECAEVFKAIRSHLLRFSGDCLSRAAFIYLYEWEITLACRGELCKLEQELVRRAQVPEEIKSYIWDLWHDFSAPSEAWGFGDEWYSVFRAGVDEDDMVIVGLPGILRGIPQALTRIAAERGIALFNGISMNEFHNEMKSPVEIPPWYENFEPALSDIVPRPEHWQRVV